ncbi:YigZ family protein [Peptoniphilus indolicus]|uniref:IMPACT family member yigZ n=3 Tax=Peptoniphilus indolicus TaxID=33030 RepID=A0A379DCW0_9FIRM|nr:YigZ family protein [Peptoniphilus indolicus]SUB75709.1 IMPACT family member yigZ [Peptoniphilus indolicus]
MFLSIFKNGRDEFIEKKSKFIGHSFIIHSEEEALEKLEKIKSEYKDATHNCSAYIIGEDRLIQRYNDDGEPSGTAGIPMLEVLKKEELTNVLVVATRYFGGTLLGAGGLVRAYTKTAKVAIDAGIVVSMIEHEEIAFSYDYTFHGAITNYLIKNEYIILNENYTDKVEVTLHRRLDDDKLIKDMMNMTGGGVSYEVKNTLLLPVKENKILY